MLAAHMDEIGFLVRFIDDKGFLRLQPVGGFDPRQLFAQRVLVHTRDGGRLRGVLTYSTKPTHMLTPEEQKAAPVIENFFVDLGLKADDVKKNIRLGDMVTMDRSCERCGENIIGKCMDNRVGVFVMIEAMKAVKKHEVDVYAVATTQEEVGLRGATTSAYAIHPDIGVALDTTLANDFPGITDSDHITKLGAGVGIKIMDASFICHPKLVDHFRAVAEKEKIAHQMEVLPRGGTDGAAMQRSRGGLPSITLSVPTRYIHTVNEMVCEKDVESAINLLARYLECAHGGDYKY
jgi:endoglucanase